MMYLSIIIPTCNRPQTLKLCLDQLLKSAEHIGCKYEIIVSDDSSDDLTSQLIGTNYPEIIHSKGPKKGPACNRNNGVKSSKGEWLIFIDDDCIPNEYILSAYIQAITFNKKTAAFEGKIDLERPQERFNESAPINLNGGFFWTCNVAIKRDLFTELGCFDERLGMSMEDIAFRELLRKNKIEFIFVPEAVVVHPWKRETVKWILKDSFNKYHSTLMYKKYYPDVSTNITAKHYLKSVAYRLFYSLKKIGPYKGKGLHVILIQSAIDIYHGLRLNFDLKK